MSTMLAQTQARFAGAFRPARPQSRAVICNSINVNAENLNRRAALTAGLVATGALFAAPVPKAWALM